MSKSREVADLGSTVTVDSTNGNVGINQDSPVNKLDVDGVIRSSAVDDDNQSVYTNFDTTGKATQVYISADSATNGAQYLISYGSPHPQAGDLALKNNASGGDIYLQTNNEERIRVTSAGNVGVGTSIPAAKFTVKGQTVLGAAVAESANLSNLTSGTPPQLVAGWSVPPLTWAPASFIETVVCREGDCGIDILASNDQSSLLNFSDTDDEDVGQIEYNHANNAMRFKTVATERMRIDSAGNVGINTGSPSETLTVGGGAARLYGANWQQLKLHTGTNALWAGIQFGDNVGTGAGSVDGSQLGWIRWSHSDGNTQSDAGGSGNAAFILASSEVSNRLGFNNEATTSTNGTNRGSIYWTTTGTAYVTSSDRRLKENIETITNGTDKLMAMNPVTHTWKDAPDAPRTNGFIAQEMQAIVPEAVTGEDGGDEMMGMDYGRITPVIVAALQEAITKIEALEARIEALEA